MIVGAFVPRSVWRDAPGVGRLLDTLARAGVHAVFTEAEEYEASWVELAHGHGLRFMAGVACFSDHARGNAVLRSRPELWPVLQDGSLRPFEDWYVGVTPTYEDYAEQRLRKVEEVAAGYGVDGLVLDFVRWPLRWEVETRPGRKPLQAGFDPHTLRRFDAWSGLRVPHGQASDRARWVLQHTQDAWREFRCAVITEFVAEAARRARSLRPGLWLGLYAVPLPPEDQEMLTGQRIGALTQHVDVVAPMAYHRLVERPVPWVAEVVAHHAASAPGRVLPVVQVDGPPWEVEEAVALALGVRGVCGVVVFPGTAVEDAERQRALRRGLGSETSLAAEDPQLSGPPLAEAERQEATGGKRRNQDRQGSQDL